MNAAQVEESRVTACPEDYFWRKVQIRGANECWPHSKPSAGGYALVWSANGHVEGAHRRAFHLANGYLPDLLIMHTCDNPPCCNPAHLVAGSEQDNSDDMVSKRRHGRGEHSENARLTAEQVNSIRGWVAENGRPYGYAGKLAREYGIDRSNLWKILTRKTWASDT